MNSVFCCCFLFQTKTLWVSYEDENRRWRLSDAWRWRNRHKVLLYGTSLKMKYKPTYLLTNQFLFSVNVTMFCYESCLMILCRLEVYSKTILFIERKLHIVHIIPRGVYCALSAARLTNIMTPELTHGTADFIARLVFVTCLNHFDYL